MSQYYTFFYYAREPKQTRLQQVVLTIQLSYSMHKSKPGFSLFFHLFCEVLVAWECLRTRFQLHSGPKVKRKHYIQLSFSHYS